MHRKVMPGNIYSGSRTLAALTNPTELAFRKGNVKKHYPLTFRGQEFEDAEAAFNHHKSSKSFNELQELCVEIILAKFHQYPQLHHKISELGGSEWVKQCSHFTYARTAAFQRWEGKGVESAFIRCLLKAYVTFPDKAHPSSQHVLF